MALCKLHGVWFHEPRAFTPSIPVYFGPKQWGCPAVDSWGSNSRCFYVASLRAIVALTVTDFGYVYGQWIARPKWSELTNGLRLQHPPPPPPPFPLYVPASSSSRPWAPKEIIRRRTRRRKKNLMWGTLGKIIDIVSYVELPSSIHTHTHTHTHTTLMLKLLTGRRTSKIR